MRTPLLFVFMLAAALSAAPWSSPVAAQQADARKLREAVKLPTMSLGFAFGVHFSGTHGLVNDWARPDSAAEVASILKAMQGIASDAARDYRLGELYEEMEKKEEAKKAYATAATLYRQQAKERPEDGNVLAGLGLALEEVDGGEEARKVLQRATEVAPQEWRVWTALGEFHRGRLAGTLFDKSKLPQKEADLAQVLADPKTAGVVTPARVADALKLLEEARACYDRAVAAAPREPAAYAERASFRATDSMMRQFARALAQGEQAVDPQAMFGPDVAADLWKVAALREDDPLAVLSAAVTSILAGVLKVAGRQMGDVTPDRLLESLPAESQASAREAISRLERFAKGEKKEGASLALQALGMLQFLAGDRAGAEASLRRAIALDPSRAMAWDLLGGLMVMGERWDDLAALGHERLGHSDGAPEHLLLAKTYDRLKDAEKAEAEVRTALQREPGHFIAMLALAALLLRKDDAAALEQAGALIEKAAAGRKDPLTEEDENWADYLLIRAVHLALTRKADDARKEVRRVLARDAQNENAKQVAKALGE